MSLDNISKLIIKSKFSFSYPKKWDLSDINHIIIGLVQKEGLEYFDLSQNLAPSFVLKFINYSIYYKKPTYWENFLSYFSSKDDATFLTHLRVIKKINHEIPFQIIITLSPKKSDDINYYECEIEIQPIIYQKIFQKIISLDYLKNDSLISDILLHNKGIINRIINGLAGHIIEEPHFDNIPDKKQIFISHSKNDSNLQNFINKPFATSNVEAIYEEYESFLHGEISIQKITSDIQRSVAIFVLLSENVNNLSYTRDWVAFESGYAAALKKDVWVFEPIGDRNKFSFVTPGLTDYVPFVLDNEDFLKFFKTIIESYDYVLIPKVKPSGVAIECQVCHSRYNVHCPANFSFSADVIRCPVCNEPISSAISSQSKK